MPALTKSDEGPGWAEGNDDDEEDDGLHRGSCKQTWAMHRNTIF